MTHKCMNPDCFHKGSDHSRGTEIQPDGRILRPFNGQCRIPSCTCESFTLFFHLPDNKVRQIFKLKREFSKEVRPEFKKEIFKKIVAWWKEFEIQYQIPIKTVQSIKSDGRVLFKK